LSYDDDDALTVPPWQLIEVLRDHRVTART